MPQRAFGLAIISASWSRIVVLIPARPGATSFGPPLKPAKKCGSTKPVVMRTSASTQRRLSQTGTRGSSSPRYARPASSNALWLTTR